MVRALHRHLIEFPRTPTGCAVCDEWWLGHTLTVVDADDERCSEATIVGVILAEYPADVTTRAAKRNARARRTGQDRQR